MRAYPHPSRLVPLLIFAAAALSLDAGAEPVLSSTFDAHGSPDNAPEFTGIVWVADGVSVPSGTVVLSEGNVQTSGAVANADRLAVARNIDTVGPWSIDIAFDAQSAGIVLGDLTFDYQFISNGGANQGFAHLGSGVVTVSILDANSAAVLSTVTLPPLGTAEASSNIGTDVVADFEDVGLVAGASYILRFTVGSDVTVGNNFALDNLRLNRASDVPNFAITNVLRMPGGEVEIEWSGSPGDYLIDYSFDLSAGAWLELTDNATIEAGSDTGTFLDSTIATVPANVRVLYRVRRPG